MTRLTAADGHSFGMYENDPSGARAAVVVIQEIFGVNDHIRSVVDRFAALGYRAVAPALFDRVETDVELRYDASGVQRGRELAEQVKWAPAMADVGAAVEHVSTTGPVAVVGFCFGGSVAWRAAAELPVTAAVGYYGGQVRQMVSLVPTAPVMLHFGGEDHAIPLEDVTQVASAHPGVPIHVYEGAQHGFNCDARSSFDPISAAIAFGRTIDFVTSHGVIP